MPYVCLLQKHELQIPGRHYPPANGYLLLGPVQITSQILLHIVLHMFLYFQHTGDLSLSLSSLSVSLPSLSINENNVCYFNQLFNRCVINPVDKDYYMKTTSAVKKIFVCLRPHCYDQKLDWNLRRNSRSKVMTNSPCF